MTIKELAYAAQQRIQASVGGSIKRAQVYELLAAAFGFNSYAAFGADTVFSELPPHGGRMALQGTLIKRRCIEIGYGPETAMSASATLESFLAERRLGVASISSLVLSLRGESPNPDEESDDDPDERFDSAEDAEIGPILLSGLEAAADNGNALAHYALALIHAPDDEVDQGVGVAYWYTQAQQGHALSEVQQEWADVHAARLAQAASYEHHLREAGRLGNQDALLDLADRFDDPSFFHQPRRDGSSDPAAVAEIAARMGRSADARHWLTVAAESGDTDAMLELIEGHDQQDLQRCWTWVYLSQLVGADLTQGAHYAINEDGSDYDDDVGGPAYVAGRDGVDLEPLSAEQDATARLAAQKLFEQTGRRVR